MKTLTLSAAAIGLALASTPALAGEGAVRTEKVSFADINLSTPEGRKVLDQRIDRAAKNVCRVADIRTGTRLKSPEVRACYAKVKTTARDQVASIQDERRLGG